MYEQNEPTDLQEFPKPNKIRKKRLVKKDKIVEAEDKMVEEIMSTTMPINPPQLSNSESFGEYFVSCIKYYLTTKNILYIIILFLLPFFAFVFLFLGFRSLKKTEHKSKKINKKPKKEIKEKPTKPQKPKKQKYVTIDVNKSSDMNIIEECTKVNIDKNTKVKDYRLVDIVKKSRKIKHDIKQEEVLNKKIKDYEDNAFFSHDVRRYDRHDILHAGRRHPRREQPRSPGRRGHDPQRSQLRRAGSRRDQCEVSGHKRPEGPAGRCFYEFPERLGMRPRSRGLRESAAHRG